MVFEDICQNSKAMLYIGFGAWLGWQIPREPSGAVDVKVAAPKPRTFAMALILATGNPALTNPATGCRARRR